MTTAGDPTLFRIDASSGPSGQKPTGTVVINICPGGSCPTITFSFGGNVTCMRLSGNHAVVGYYGPITHPSLSDPFRPRGLIEFIDNGTAGPDELKYEYRPIRVSVPGEPPNPLDVPITTCPSSVTPNDFFPRLTGVVNPAPVGWEFPENPQNFTVKDAKEPRFFKLSDCRLGGWARIGFVSRRQCDNFVRWQCRDGRHTFYGFPTIVHCRIATRS